MIIIFVLIFYFIIYNHDILCKNKYKNPHAHPSPPPNKTNPSSAMAATAWSMKNSTSSIGKNVSVTKGSSWERKGKEKGKRSKRKRCWRRKKSRERKKWGWMNKRKGREKSKRGRENNKKWGSNWKPPARNADKKSLPNLAASRTTNLSALRGSRLASSATITFPTTSCKTTTKPAICEQPYCRAEARTAWAGRSATRGGNVRLEITQGGSPTPLLQDQTRYWAKCLRMEICRGSLL